MNALLMAVSIASGVMMLALVLAQSFESANAGKTYSAVFNLFMVGAAGFALGAFAGFVFGAVGDEKQSFAGIATVLNGVIGGFALSDLTKSDSLIKRVLFSLALSCGLERSGLVACVIAVFGSLGFMFMYMNKQYLLNPALSKAHQMAEQNQILLSLTRNVKVSLAEIGSQPKIDAKVLEAIKSALKEFEATTQKDPELVDRLTVEALKSYSKAYYAAGELNKAESMLRKARNQSPDDQDTLFYLSHVLITAQRPVEAIPYLVFLQAMPNPPVLTWKLIGYACLFDASRLDESERATEKHIYFFSNDAGAHLNLACVGGQRGPAEAANVTKVIERLKLTFQLDPNLKTFVKDSLTKPGEDFAAWIGIPEFDALLA